MNFNILNAVPKIQKTTNAHFFFAGNQRHLMNGMFTSLSRPFYQMPQKQGAVFLAKGLLYKDFITNAN